MQDDDIIEESVVETVYKDDDDITTYKIATPKKSIGKI